LHRSLDRAPHRWLSADEDRIDAELALGQHAELVSELEAMVRAHPSRERLLGQLLLALCPSGRQADALGAYRTARRLRQRNATDRLRI
jgi:DNA-binding SARP family transcriptional activator